MTREVEVRLDDELLEELAVVSLFNSSEEVQIYLLAEIKDSLIHNKPFKEVLTRVKHLLKSKAQVPTKVDLYYDPTLPQGTLLLLRESRFNEQPLSSLEEARSTVERLTEFAKKRKLLGAYEVMHNFFTKPDTKVELKDVVKKISSKLYEISSNTTTTEDSITDVLSTSTLGMVKKLLTEVDTTKFIPTGFKQFDQVNRGLPRGGLTILGASTGGGKSCSVNYMAYNMAVAGYRVCIVSLEMSEWELLERRVAFLTETTLTELKHQRFSNQQVEKYLKIFEDYQEKIRSAGGLEQWKCKANDQTIEELLYSLKPFNYDVIFIDYLGLLRGVGGDSQWQKLGEAARFCKIFAEENNMNVIACVQLSNDGEVRYSKAIIEHANNSFTWVYGKKEIESQIIEIEQKKGRMSERFNFYIKVDFSTMSMKDLEGNDRDTYLSQKRADINKPLPFKSARNTFLKPNN